MTEKHLPDWDRIELDYRAGIKSLRQIADEHGIAHSAISKRAKRDDWSRDLSAKIKAKSDELVNKSLVNSKVNNEKRVSERQTIDANAVAITDVRLSQRTNIQRTQKILMSLFDELELQVGQENADLLTQLGELMRQENDKGEDKRNDLYMKIISLQGRAGTMKSLTESLKTVVALERQAFGLDDKDNAPVDALTSLLHGIAKSNTNGLQPIERDPEHDEDDK